MPNRTLSSSAFIALGSNLGRRRSSIQTAVRRISVEPGFVFKQMSNLFETEPVGGPPQRAFLNGVMEVEVSISPQQVLRRLLAIERSLGRRRRIKWGPRVIDLDLIFYGARVVRRRGLILPHPRCHERRFVMVPLAQIAPDLLHPTLKRTARQLARELTVIGQRVTIDSTWKKSRFYPYKRRKKRSSRSSP